MQRISVTHCKDHYPIELVRYHTDPDFSGGLGLTGGIADVGSLFDSLVGIHKGLADETILDKYSEIRKRIWAEIIDPISRENFRRLYDQDPTKAREYDEFFQLCVKGETDEETAKSIVLVSSICLGILHRLLTWNAGIGYASA
jgi:hypothetical protein